MEVVDLPVPEIGPREVLVKVSVCGTCMSEFPLWEQGTDVGRRLGHEGVGTIVAVGDEVEDFRVGDRVSGIINKSFAEYASADCDSIIPVPDSLEDHEAIGEPLGCLVSAAERIRIPFGADLAMVGTGFMGLSIMKMMLLRGAGRVIAVDIREEALRNARRMGASETYLPKDLPPEYKITEWQGDLFRQGIDYVVEASGTPDGLALAGDMTRPHGTLSVVGYHQTEGGYRNINMTLWNWKAITVINAHERRYGYLVDCCRRALQMIAEGRLDMRPMYTNAYSLDEINRAFRDMRDKPEGYIKGYIRF